MDKTMEFWTWAEQELERRNLNWHRVERQAGLSNASISRRAREILPPTETTCQALATALEIPAEEVFRRAGILPPIPADDQDRDTALWLWDQIADDDTKAMVLDAIRGIVNGEKQRERERKDRIK